MREQSRQQERRHFLIQSRVALLETDADDLESKVEELVRKWGRTQVAIIVLLFSVLGYMVARDVFGEGQSNAHHYYQQENRTWQNPPVIVPPMPSPPRSAS